MDSTENIYEEACQLFRNGKFDDCILSLKGLMYRNLEQVEYMKLLGDAYLYKCNFTTAITVFQITCLECLHSHENCLTTINRRLEKQADNVDMFMARARLQLLLSNLANCFSDVKRVLEIDPRNINAEEMRKSFEGNAEQLRSLALKAAYDGNLAESLRKISGAIKVNPDVIENHVIRAVFHRYRGDFNAAIDDLKFALMRCHKACHHSLYKIAYHQFILTLNDLAVHCFSLNFFKEGLLLLEKAIKKEKRLSSLYINRGDCFMKLGDVHFALLDYQQANEIDGNTKLISQRLASVYNLLGVNNYMKQKYQVAENYFDSAIHEYPTISSFILRAKTRYPMKKIKESFVDIWVAQHMMKTNKKESLSSICIQQVMKQVDKVWCQAEFCRFLDDALENHLDIRR